MALDLHYPAGATPIDPDEAAGLIPRGVTTIGELNVYEAENILAAHQSLSSRRHVNILSDGFLRDLHRRMFGNTWRWSGTYRTTGKNIGVDAQQIAVAIRELTLNCQAQLAAAAMSLDEIAARFHHRLVWIHAFPNGNGRHARLAADILLEQNGAPTFSWGATNLVVDGPVRDAYIDALRQADRGSFQLLLQFVRS